MELEKNLQQQASYTLTIYTYEGKKYILGWDLNTLGYYGEINDGEEKYYEVSDDNINEICNNYRGEMKIEYEEIPKYNLKTTSVANPNKKNPFPTEFGRKFTNRYQKNNSNGWITTGTYQIPTEKQTSPTTEELINQINNMKSVEELKKFKNIVYMVHDAAEKQLALPEYSIEQIINMKGKDFIIRKPSPLEEKQFNKDSTFRKQSSSEQELFEKIKNLPIEELNTLIDTIFNIENPKSTHARR